MKKRVVACILAVACIASLSGCGSKFNGQNTVAEVGDEKVTADVANFFARYQQAQFETTYGSYLGDDFWDKEVSDGKTYEQDAMAGIDKGWVRILDVNYAIVPKDTDRIVDDTIEDLVSGKTQVFSGPFTGVNPNDENDRIDLRTPYIENETSSSPSFSYVLDDVITIVP